MQGQWPSTSVCDYGLMGYLVFLRTLFLPLNLDLTSLTLALMGSDDLNLRVLSTSSDDPKERKAAAKVLRLLQRGRHWVLVVLLLGNVVCLRFSFSLRDSQRRSNHIGSVAVADAVLAVRSLMSHFLSSWTTFLAVVWLQSSSRLP